MATHPTTRRVVICGDLNLNDRPYVAHIMGLHVKKHDVIITGGALGVAQAAHEQAEAWGMKTELVDAEWRDEDGELDKSAVPRRNANMAENCDVVIAIWDGKSRGARNMIENGLRCLREIHVYPGPVEGYE